MRKTCKDCSENIECLRWTNDSNAGECLARKWWRESESEVTKLKEKVSEYEERIDWLCNKAVDKIMEVFTLQDKLKDK